MGIKIKHYIGWRNIKTSLAVLVCLLIGRVMQNDFPLYSCTAAIICMKDTVGNSVKHGIIRIKATVTGGIIAISFLALNEYLPFYIPKEVIVPLAIMLTIYCCGVLEWKEAAALSCVVVLVILLIHNYGAEKYIYAVNRVIETLMGIIVAVVINKFVVPPQDHNKDEKEEHAVMEENAFEIDQGDLK